MSLKRKLHEALEEQGNDMDDPSALLAGVGIGERGSTIVKKLLEFLDDLDDDGFEALNDFQSKNWRHFLPKNLGGRAASVASTKRASTAVQGKSTHASASSASSPVVAPALFSFSVGSNMGGGNVDESSATSTAKTPAQSATSTKQAVPGGHRVVTLARGTCAKADAPEVSVSGSEPARASTSSSRNSTSSGNTALSPPAPVLPGGARTLELHREYCGLLEKEVNAFVGTQGLSMDQLFERVRCELRQHAEQRAAMEGALRLGDGGGGGKCGDDQGCGGSGGGASKRRRRQLAPLERVFENEEEGVLALVKFIDDATDPSAFVESMREYARSRLVFETHARSGYGAAFGVTGVSPCTWCNRDPCFDPWHQTPKSDKCK